MPQQHNPGRHVQSLTLPQSRHNHRNTSAYIFPTVSTPRTTPPAPGPNAPTQFASAIQDTSPPPHNGSTVPKPRTIPPTPEPATRRALPRHASPPSSNAPTFRRNSPAPFKTLPHRRTTAPTPSRRLEPPRRHRATPRRRALPRLSAGPQRSNSPSQRSRPIQGTHLPPHAGPHRPDASDHPADTRQRLAAGTLRSNSPSQLARSIQDTPLPPHNGPTPSQPSDHPAGAGFNRTAGHKKIRLCEPDLFICQ